MVMITAYSIAAARLDYAEELAAIMAEAQTIDPGEISDFIVAMVAAAGVEDE
jgi:hypothetical protein